MKDSNNNIINPSEFGKRCELCHKNRPSRQYYRMIDGEGLKVCQECWNKLEENKRNRNNDK